MKVLRRNLPRQRLPIPVPPQVQLDTVPFIPSPSLVKRYTYSQELPRYLSDSQDTPEIGQEGEEEVDEEEEEEMRLLSEKLKLLISEGTTALAAAPPWTEQEPLSPAESRASGIECDQDAAERESVLEGVLQRVDARKKKQNWWDE